ncbi:uncharacterized protein K452DRAFT_295216 [Aplosporella prunicola CBS 121167]|uniref:Uncharacterized protein n=1 Tax=Aplosporella prunicola CBS 121167 TaxID=1176127 RepID=A0A6A6BQU5_9PEZI|nr:uncharacterized protein K452DRAFT_295216 [Aplosporella prunicola CBS 121167]KAF2145614.1 hypothetical protein K452DRAFT_295216 [Aplosporella prunicola CBS 121167]
MSFTPIQNAINHIERIMKELSLEYSDISRDIPAEHSTKEITDMNNAEMVHIVRAHPEIAARMPQSVTAELENIQNSTAEDTSAKNDEHALNTETGQAMFEEIANRLREEFVAILENHADILEEHAEDTGIYEEEVLAQDIAQRVHDESVRLHNEVLGQNQEARNELLRGLNTHCVSVVDDIVEKVCERFDLHVSTFILLIESPSYRPSRFENLISGVYYKIFMNAKSCVRQWEEWREKLRSGTPNSV